MVNPVAHILLTLVVTFLCFFKIAYPFTLSCIAYAGALTLAGNVIEFAPLFACYWLVKSMGL